MKLDNFSDGFTKERSQEVFEILSRFNTGDEVYFHEDLKPYYDTMLLIVSSKHGWSEYGHKDRYGDFEDLIQQCYVYAPRIFLNVWKRMKDPSNPIQDLYSYLYRAIQNKMWEFIRSQDHLIPIEHIAEFADQEEELRIGATGEGHIPKVLEELGLRLFREEFLEILDSIVFRMSDANLIACYWLRERYKERYNITLEDLNVFSSLPLRTRKFIFDYVEVCLKRALYPLSQRYHTIFRSYLR